MEVSAMNCHHRFYTLEDFFKSAHENGFRNVSRRPAVLGRQNISPTPWLTERHG